MLQIEKFRVIAGIRLNAFQAHVTPAFCLNYWNGSIVL